MQPTTKRPLATVWHDIDLLSGSDEWLIQCECCGHRSRESSMEAAGADFFQHMYFGFDTSDKHYRYAAGHGRKLWRTPAKGGVR